MQDVYVDLYVHVQLYIRLSILKWNYFRDLRLGFDFRRKHALKRLKAGRALIAYGTDSAFAFKVAHFFGLEMNTEFVAFRGRLERLAGRPKRGI